MVVLGHIDHGKTSLLLAIRKMEIPSGKPGGAITQHIGAFEIENDGKKITFIDTPGHEAFSQMRSRGARVADLAILVIAADEGVKPQTREAISHIKQAGIPMIVALNKIDKPEADPLRVQRELAKEGVLIEKLGGKIPLIEISAKTGQGIAELLELISLVAEIEDLRTDLHQLPQGVIIEAYLDSQKGPTATLILNQGILKIGQIVATPSTLGKIKNLANFQGIPISEAFPSQPVVCLGFEEVPQIGEEFRVFETIEEAKNYLKISEKKPLPEPIIKPEQKVLNFIIKADVLGSLEAIEEILKNLPQKKIILRVLRSDVGEVTESDVKLASQASAKILAFRVKINPVAQALLRREKIKVMQFNLIYDLVEGVRKYMAEALEPAIVRIDLGKIKVLVIFLMEKNRQIIGGRVIEGEIKKGGFIEIVREGEIRGKGKIINLQKNKKDIEKASKGEEVGILYEGDIRIEVGDTLIVYTEERKKEEL